MNVAVRTWRSGGSTKGGGTITSARKAPSEQRAKAFTNLPPQHSTWPGLTVSSILCMLSLEYAQLLYGAASGSGFHPHLPGFKYKFLSTAMGATMWFFIFYRARCVLCPLTLGFIFIIYAGRMVLNSWYLFSCLISLPI